MRIKIKGEITAERLAEALQKASEQYERVRPGHKIYGANLYITAFDADGLPFDLVDHRGESLSITIEAKSGELVKPALTAEGEQRRQQAKEEAKRLEAEAEAKAAEYERERQKTLVEHHRKQREKEAQARQQFEVVNTITASLLETMPERFVDELNKTVQGVWDDLKPVEPSGKKKGQPKPLPVFQIHAGGLVLAVDTWKNPRQLRNPICTLQHDEIAPLWMHDAWLETMKRVVPLLEELSASEADAAHG
jgi:hypothetical protein